LILPLDAAAVQQEPQSVVVDVGEAAADALDVLDREVGGYLERGV